MLGIPQPAAKEQFLQALLEAMDPLARRGFEYLRRARRGARKGAQARWANQEESRSRIKQAAIALLRNHHPRRGLALRSKQRLGLTLSVQQINSILRRLNI